MCGVLPSSVTMGANPQNFNPISLRVVSHMCLTRRGSPTAHGTNPISSKLLSLSTSMSCKTRSPASPQIVSVPLHSSFFCGISALSVRSPTCPYSRCQPWTRQKDFTPDSIRPRPFRFRPFPLQVTCLNFSLPCAAPFLSPKSRPTMASILWKIVF